PIGHRVSWNIIDVGAGSGCIIIALAKLLKRNLKANLKASKRLFAFKFAFKFLATDISSSALAVARKNAKLHNVQKNITFMNGNLLEPLIQNPKYLKHLNGPIIITANLPYLIQAQIKNSPTIQQEPKLALSAGADGLKYYRRLFKQIKRIKNQESRITILVEINPEQATKIKQLIKKELPNSKIQIKKDLAGLNRLIVIKLLTS
ncbi:hypothetical protein KAU19_04010, partial [Candidatus Parcubacteria bacterium]|nr:hypothetical protein [Candidatus Parcubacteria bacterium]